jgi:multidrug resistance efflux pump
MPNCAISAQTNNGKTRLIKHFLIQVGDPAEVKPMGYSAIVRGHVDSIARAINIANARPNDQGVATVNPVFTWVRLAQRIPVRIHIDEVPEGGCSPPA